MGIGVKTPAIPDIIHIQDERQRKILQSIKERIEKLSTVVDGMSSSTSNQSTQGERGPRGFPGTNGVDGNDNLYIQETDPSPVPVMSMWVKLVPASDPPEIEGIYLVTP